MVLSCQTKAHSKLAPLLFLLTSFATSELVAQTGSLRILNYSPRDSGTSGSLVTVTFDRPVAGMRSRDVEPGRAMTLSPSIPGTTEWRDPTTLRFVPRDPFEPGRLVAVSIDTAFVASGGTRSGIPHRFTFSVPGASPLEILVQGIHPHDGSVGPRPLFQVLYSAPVNLDSVAQLSKLEFPADCGGTIPLVVQRQREVSDADSRRIRAAGGWDRDTVADRFRRVVELIPRDSLKPSCGGHWHVPSFDPRKSADAWKHNVRTEAEFKVTGATACLTNNEIRPDYCDPNGLEVQFGSPVSFEQLRKHVRVTPQLPLPAGGSASTMLQFRTPLTPRTSYTVTVDTAIRDIYNRKLAGASSFVVRAADRRAGVRQQTGLVTFRTDSTRPTIRIRTVNVDTVRMHIVGIPDARIESMLHYDGYFRAFDFSHLARATDSIVVDYPVRGLYNLEHESVLELPASIVSPGRSGWHLNSIRFSVKTRTIAPDSVAHYERLTRERALVRWNPSRPFTLSTVVTVGGHSDAGLLAQVSNLTAHAKIAGARGAVYVTNADGKPADRAEVTLYEGAREPIAHAITDEHGLAILKQLREPRGAAVIRRSPYGVLRYLDVRMGNDRLILPLRGSFSDSPVADFSVTSLGAIAGDGALLSAQVQPERDIYRPGEMLYVKGTVRRGMQGTLAAPVGDSVRLLVTQSDDTLHTRLGVLSAFGTIVDSLRIPASARLGHYTIALQTLDDGEWVNSANGWFRIAEFRAPEFLLQLHHDSLPKFLGDTILTGIDARYLFGMPMSGAQFKWSAYATRAERWELDLPGTQGYDVGTHDWWSWERRTTPTVILRQSTSDSLDSSGKGTLRLSTSATQSTQPMRVHIAAAIVDINNQSVTSARSTILHTSRLYIAARLRGRSWILKTGVPQTIDVFALRPGGQRVSGVDLRVTIIRRTPGEYGYGAYPSGAVQWVADTVEKFTTRTTMDTVPVTFTPALEGAYDVRIEATDENGGLATTNTGRWAYNLLWYNPPGENPLKLRILPQSEPHIRHKLGDTARFTFHSPFNVADAWITTEREGVIDQRVVRVGRGEQTVSVSVKPAYAPGVWLGITLMNRDTTKRAGTDSLIQVLRTGYAELSVDSTAHMLQVKTKPSQSVYAPGDSLTVKLEVSQRGTNIEGNGNRAEIALWAVDEGVLSLTGYKASDILAFMDARRGVAPTLATALVTLPWLTATGYVNPGSNVRLYLDYANGARAPFSVGSVPAMQPLRVVDSVYQDGASTQSDAQFTPVSVAVRSDFRFTAFYVGTATTDSLGFATIRTKLPDNITTFRLMARALSAGNRYGSSDTSILVTRRIVLRPALPRFLRYGDELTGGVIANLFSLKQANLTVRADVAGVMLRGMIVRQVNVTDQKGALARYSLTVPPDSRARSATIRFSALNESRNEGDAVQSVLPLRPVAPVRTHTAIGSVTDTGTVTITLPWNIDPEQSTVSLAMGSSPIVAMRTHYERLRDYRFSCTEQLTTRARALLTLVRAERILGDSSLVTRDSVKVVHDLQAAVEELLRRQTWNGSFAYWPGTSYTVGPWLTAYVGMFLLDARREGLNVPEMAISRIARHLDEYAEIDLAVADTVTGSPHNRRWRLQNLLGIKVVVLRFLREAGAARPSAETSLLANANSMAWEDRLLLADLLWDHATHSARAREMLQHAWSSVQVIGKRIEMADSLRGAAPFPSHIRPAARLLSIARRRDPSNAMLGALAETLIQQGHAEKSYAWNTQDYGEAMEALASLVESQTLTGSMRLSMRSYDGREVLARAPGGGAQGADTTRYLNGLIQKSADGSMSLKLSVKILGNRVNNPIAFFYSVSVNEIPRDPPVTPDIKGITVERWYEKLENGEPVNELTEGDLVRVRLRVTVPADRQFVAVEDMLPAGLEPIDVTLKTSRELGPFIDANNDPHAALEREQPNGSLWQNFLYGSWENGWWTPWEYREMRDDRVVYFARQLWSGVYTASYVARATTAGTFIKPPAHAEEMYNPAVQGRSGGGVLLIRGRER